MASTQDIAHTQIEAAAALGVHASKVLVRVKRIGEDPNILYTCSLQLSLHFRHHPVLFLCIVLSVMYWYTVCTYV